MFNSKKDMTHDEKNDLLKIEEGKMYLLKKVGLKDRFNFYEYIATMVDGGVTITDALESILGRIGNAFFREKIKELRLFISS